MCLLQDVVKIVMKSVAHGVVELYNHLVYHEINGVVDMCKNVVYHRSGTFMLYRYHEAQYVCSICTVGSTVVLHCTSNIL